MGRGGSGTMQRTRGCPPEGQLAVGPPARRRLHMLQAGSGSRGRHPARWGRVLGPELRPRPSQPSPRPRGRAQPLGQAVRTEGAGLGQGPKASACCIAGACVPARRGQRAAPAGGPSRGGPGAAPCRPQLPARPPRTAHSSRSAQEGARPRPRPALGGVPPEGAGPGGLSSRPHCQLAEQYGPVFTVHLGGQKTVVLTGYQAVREALVCTGQELADRPPIPIFQLIQGGRGIFFSSGPRWRAARQHAVRALHGLGVGRAPVADKVLQELRCLVGQLDEYGGRPFPLALLGWAPSNVTFTLLFGRRFDYQDPVFRSLLGLIDDVMVLLGTPGLQLFNLYPRLGALLGLHRPVLRKIDEVRAILRALLAARPPPGGGPVHSYVDALRQQGQGGDPDGVFSEANVVACVLDMVMAGTETTSATLQWAALLMGRHPGVQDRVQEELDRVLGPGRPPQPEDQRALPYTSAVLHEVQRFITLLPHAPRCSAGGTRLGGYLLPKGTPVLPLLSSVLLDETQWETPGQFNPGHFLDADGHFVKREAFLPFSAGRRVCLGERLARTELFLLFAGLLQSFRLRPPPGLGPAGLRTVPAPAFTMRPPAQVLCAVPRPQGR